MSFQGFRQVCSAIVCLLLVTAAVQAQSGAELSGQNTVAGERGNRIHYLPNRQVFEATHPAGVVANVTPALTYHGGEIMTTLQIYQIFWKPASGKLQDGTTATTFSAKYQPKLSFLNTHWHGRPLDALLGIYSQVVGSVKTYYSPTGALGGTYNDTNPYPVSACTGLTNCITDAQLQTELQNVMTAKSWTGGANKLFILYTSSAEISCFDSSPNTCSSNYYCGYHSNVVAASPDILYANIPYGDPAGCGNFTTPPNDGSTDAAASTVSHEISETVTDPLGTAWYDSSGNEIGDLCDTVYGTLDWNGGLANQFYAGTFYILQEEYDNHKSACVKYGP
jgi:hypothetical protein